ncbi:MAG: hypothetical protein AAB227_07300, partial [Pseudomonadota bacterium]
MTAERRSVISCLIVSVFMGSVYQIRMRSQREFCYDCAMRFMLGVDEAGRGPLAGPVSVGVVAVPERFDVALEFPGVADSKKLSEKKREKIFEMLEA